METAIKKNRKKNPLRGFILGGRLPQLFALLGFLPLLASASVCTVGTGCAVGTVYKYDLDFTQASAQIQASCYDAGYIVTLEYGSYVGTEQICQALSYNVHQMTITSSQPITGTSSASLFSSAVASSASVSSSAVSLSSGTSSASGSPLDVESFKMGFALVILAFLSAMPFGVVLRIFRDSSRY